MREDIPPEYRHMILDELNVKELVHDPTISSSCELDTTLTPELKVEGDVRNLMRSIQDTRKEKGLTPKDRVVLVLSYTLPESFKDLVITTCNVSSIEEGSGPYEVSLSTGTVSFDIC